MVKRVKDFTQHFNLHPFTWLIDIFHLNRHFLFSVTLHLRAHSARMQRFLDNSWIMRPNRESARETTVFSNFILKNFKSINMKLKIYYLF